MTTRSSDDPRPLRVSSANPRYFAIGSGADERPVYLTGSHVNNNLHDGLGFGRECPDEPERFDYDAYLDFLLERGHNFIRLWRWEQFRGHLEPADVHFCMTPQPWPRTGPGPAKDGKPRFDLSRFDDAYFDRLRHRVQAAGRRGVYVSVMLFDGFSLHLTAVPDNIEGHPFWVGNNVNDIGITSILDYQVLPLDERVRSLQESYIGKVIDTVQDLPNVLYEVANESSGQAAQAVVMPDGTTIDTPIGDSTEWQYWVIETIKNYERTRGYTSHPVGMTFLYPVPDQSRANDPLWRGPADWISPGLDDGPEPGANRWSSEPPVNDGRKVVLSDTDHYAPFGADALWAWKTFLRGHYPVLYDLGIVAGPAPEDPTAGQPSFASLEPARRAMGCTRRLAEQVRLLRLEPRPDLCSTGFALADPGQEYVTLQPDATEPLSITLDPGRYAVRWYGLVAADLVASEELSVDESGPCSLEAPDAPAVVHLVRLGSSVST